MKVRLVVDVDLEAMKEEDTLDNWRDTLQKDYGVELWTEGTDDQKWEQIACELAYNYIAGGDYDMFFLYVKTEVEK